MTHRYNQGVYFMSEIIRSLRETQDLTAAVGPCELEFEGVI